MNRAKVGLKMSNQEISKGDNNMNLEYLHSLSDTELNALSIKVLGHAFYVDSTGIVRNLTTHRDWNPTGDMNDAMELEKCILDKYDKHEPSTSYFNFLVKVTEAKGMLTMDILYKLIHATPKERTIASILAKEE